MAADPASHGNYPWWAPRFWHGLRFRRWLALLRQNGFRVHPLRWGLAGTITGMTLFNSAMTRWARWQTAARLRQVPRVDNPLFVVGHWRSGTTYLHELLSCDQRFATPTTYQCFAPHHFLVTEQWIPKLLWFLMPAQRPMDNVKTTWDAPQEDEFALCSLGARSPYLRIAFPNEPHDYLDDLDFHGWSSTDREAWLRQMQWFLEQLTLATGKQLILKSPTHTARIGWLADAFPRARFLHIVRDPVSIFPSTMKLWQVLDFAQGLQIPQHTHLREYVLKAFERMYAAFEAQRARVPAERLHEIRYEDLVADPIETLRVAYQRLDLGDFQVVEPHLRARCQESRSYRTNQYRDDPDVRREVLARWGDYARRYGYSDESTD